MLYAAHYAGSSTPSPAWRLAPSVLPEHVAPGNRRRRRHPLRRRRRWAYRRNADGSFTVLFRSFHVRTKQRAVSAGHLYALDRNLLNGSGRSDSAARRRSSPMERSPVFKPSVLQRIRLRVDRAMHRRSCLALDLPRLCRADRPTVRGVTGRRALPVHRRHRSTGRTVHRAHGPQAHTVCKAPRRYSLSDDRPTGATDSTGPAAQEARPGPGPTAHGADGPQLLPTRLVANDTSDRRRGRSSSSSMPLRPVTVHLPSPAAVPPPILLLEEDRPDVPSVMRRG